MAEVLLADALRRRSLPATVSSAGLLEDGRPASPHSVTLMAERGLDLTGHASRHMTAEMLLRADLIIGMERRHVREAAVVAPDAWPRAFTLPELARRAAAVGPRAEDQTVTAWLASLVEGRTTADHLGDVAADEIADPIGRSLRTYRKCATQLDELIEVVADHLVVAVPSESTPTIRSATP